MNFIFFLYIFVSLVCFLSDEERTQDYCRCPEQFSFLFLLSHLLLTERFITCRTSNQQNFNTDSLRFIWEPSVESQHSRGNKHCSFMKSQKVALDQAPLFDEVNVRTCWSSILHDLFPHMDGLSLSTFLLSRMFRQCICANLCVCKRLLCFIQSLTCLVR